jgi:hypothetical protein
MNTSTEAIRQLEQALENARQGVKTIDNLIIEHDYQDVASLLAQSAAALLESAAALMKNEDEPALEHLSRADDLLDAVWNIIDSEVDDDEA